MRCICDLHKLCGPCRKSPDRHHISLEENLEEKVEGFKIHGHVRSNRIKNFRFFPHMIPTYKLQSSIYKVN